jgi:hypothetical protein
MNIRIFIKMKTGEIIRGNYKGHFRNAAGEHTMIISSNNVIMYLLRKDMENYSGNFFSAK